MLTSGASWAETNRPEQRTTYERIKLEWAIGWKMIRVIIFRRYWLGKGSKLNRTSLSLASWKCPSPFPSHRGGMVLYVNSNNGQYQSSRILSPSILQYPAIRSPSAIHVLSTSQKPGISARVRTVFSGLIHPPGRLSRSYLPSILTISYLMAPDTFLLP
jgi:hypothetical protein